MNTPRRPLVPAVPGPNSGSISQRAIATREAARERDTGLPTHEEVILKPDEPMPGLAPVIHRPTPSIHKAIAGVMKNIGTIKKGGRNKFHGYDYARMEDLLEKVTPLMGEAGLAIYQTETGIQHVEGNRLAVVYEFVVGHESGEERPPQRQTGVSMARDSKGNFDDKAIAKCHTNARKYFLLSLFQVPAGDFPDSDDDGGPYNANQRQERAPVPGPTQARKEQAPAQEVDESVPHKLAVPPGTTADQWAGKFLKAIGTATTVDEVKAWEINNDGFLQRISDNYPTIYEMIGSAMTRRLRDLGESQASMMPSPKADPEAAMNWVAAQLQQFQEYEAGESFWNQTVAPREGDFEVADWDMLINEWQRFETRFPQADPPQAA